MLKAQKLPCEERSSCNILSKARPHLLPNSMCKFDVVAAQLAGTGFPVRPAVGGGRDAGELLMNGHCSPTCPQIALATSALESKVGSKSVDSAVTQMMPLVPMQPQN